MAIPYRVREVTKISSPNARLLDPRSFDHEIMGLDPKLCRKHLVNGSQGITCARVAWVAEWIFWVEIIFSGVVTMIEAVHLQVWSDWLPQIAIILDLIVNFYNVMEWKESRYMRKLVNFLESSNWFLMLKFYVKAVNPDLGGFDLYGSQSSVEHLV